MSLTVVFGMGTCVSSCVWSPDFILIEGLVIQEDLEELVFDAIRDKN